MNTRRQYIDRGLEKIMAVSHRRMSGLAGGGLGAFDVSTLEEVARGDDLRRLRRAHRCACSAMKKALPVADAVMDLLTTANGPGPQASHVFVETLEGLAGLGKTSAAKAAKKLAKVQAKEAKHDAKISAKLQKYTAAGKTAKAAKVQAKEAKHDTKIAAKVAKYQGIIDTAASALKAAQPITPALATPADAAAAALVAQSGLPATDAVQSLAQGVYAPAAGGGGGGAAQGDMAQDDTSQPAGLFDSVPMPVLVGGAGLLAYLLTKGRK